jgi:hypothetical protein
LLLRHFAIRYSCHSAAKRRNLHLLVCHFATIVIPQLLSFRSEAEESASSSLSSRHFVIPQRSGGICIFFFAIPPLCHPATLSFRSEAEESASSCRHPAEPEMQAPAG